MSNDSHTPDKNAHDLKNNLGVIKLYAQLCLRDASVNPAMTDYLNTILEQASESVKLADKMSQELSIESKSRERLHMLLSNLPGFAYRCKNEPGWPMEFISEGCLELTGYQPGDFTSHSGFEYENIIHPDDRMYVNETIQKCISMGRPFTLEYRIITKNGVEKRVWEKGRQNPGSDHSDNQLEGFIMDITDKIQAEEALISSQEKLLSIFRVSPSGIGVVKDRILVEVNERICEMTGYTSDEMVGKNTIMLYPSKEEFDFVGKEKYRQIEDKGIGIVESRWRKKNGNLIDVMIASTPLIGDDITKGVIFTALDISNLKKAETEKKKMEEQLIQAQKMEIIGKLAGGVAHEFNNTLQVITSLTELSMLKVEADHPIAGHLHQIRTSVKQSSTFVGQLLAFARKQAVNPELLNLNEFVEGMLIMLQRLIGENIALKWIPAQELWTVRLDPVQVNQLLINLVLNARDAIGDKGLIIISTENEIVTDSSSDKNHDSRPGEYVMLAVSDDGCGMEDSELTRIFEPFYTTKPAGKGTGLGLATVYGIVRQNSGFILADSKPGEGTVFRIYFPRFINPE
jgi:PAS domain S-box-containing protein